MPPFRQITVIACMDARLNVYQILGLKDGEAHVIRNAGGTITDDEVPYSSHRLWNAHFHGRRIQASDTGRDGNKAGVVT